MTERNAVAGLLAGMFALVSTAGTGCAESSEPEPSRETNWLRRCSDDNDCNKRGAGSCECGLCSERCNDDSACPDGLVCKTAESALVLDACGPTHAGGLCAPECKRDADCVGDLRCLEGACAPDSTPPPADGGVRLPEGRTPQAFVTGALLPDSSCVYTGDNAVVQIGEYDIAPGAMSGSTGCEQGYGVWLGIASEEPGVIQLTGATVELMTVNRERLGFDSEENGPPNPFTFESTRTLIPPAGQETARGVYQVQAIGTEYAPYLGDFVGQQLLVEIRLHGRDELDVPISFRPFVFPLEICDGCLSRCESLLIANMIRREDFAMGQCDDNAGADGRICWDPDC